MSDINKIKTTGTINYNQITIRVGQGYHDIANRIGFINISGIQDKYQDSFLAQSSLRP